MDHKTFFNLPGINQLIGFMSVTRGLMFYPELLAYADVMSGQTIVDLGCGHGAIFYGVKEYKGLELIAIDDSPVMCFHASISKLVTCMDKNTRRVLNATATSIDLPDSSADAVIDSFCLMYEPNIKKALSEINRIMRPGGRFITTPYSDELAYMARDVFDSPKIERVDASYDDILKIIKHT